MEGEETPVFMFSRYYFLVQLWMNENWFELDG